MTSPLTLVQLYPEELGVAGDRGNLMALTARLEHAGLAVNVVEYRVGDSLPDEVDLVLVGNGPLSAMRNVHADLLALGDRLTALASSGVPFFAYGSGAELLGGSITLLDGSVIGGLHIFPFAATRTTERKVGYVITDTELGQVVGFEDNASRWTLDDGATQFGALVAGGGNGDGTTEGVIVGNSIATQIGGPALPLNPLITDTLLGSIAVRRRIAYVPGDGNVDLDRFAARAREVIVAHAKHVFSRI